MNSNILIAAAIVLAGLVISFGSRWRLDVRKRARVIGGMHLVDQRPGTVFLCTPGGGACSVYYTTQRRN
jgi:hypothetical protein